MVLSVYDIKTEPLLVNTLYIHTGLSNLKHFRASPSSSHNLWLGREQWGIHPHLRRVRWDSGHRQDTLVQQRQLNLNGEERNHVGAKMDPCGDPYPIWDWVLKQLISLNSNTVCTFCRFSMHFIEGLSVLFGLLSRAGQGGGSEWSGQ